MVIIADFCSLDEEHFKNMMSIAKLYDKYEEDLLEYIDCDNCKVDPGVLIGAVYHMVFDGVMEELEKDESMKDYVEKLREDFSPYINYINSSFENILDEIDLTDKRNLKRSINVAIHRSNEQSS